MKMILAVLDLVGIFIITFLLVCAIIFNMALNYEEFEDEKDND